MGYRAYPEMRDSGVPWLGEIPTHWNLKKTRYIAHFTTGWTPPTGNASSYEGDNWWANIGDLGCRYIEETQNQISNQAAESAGISLSPAGSLLFSFKLSVGLVSIAKLPLFTNEAIATFRPEQGFDISWAYYAFPIFIPKNSATNIYGAQLLNQQRINDAPLALPPHPEQQTIARFLDHKTAQIDALISKKEALLQKLAEKRTALISQAVTQGLDPTVPMQDSGVAWLGKIPAHWKVKRQRFLIGMNSGMTPNTGTPEFWDGDIPWVSPKDMKVEWISGSIDTLTEEALAKTAIQTFASGHVLIVVRGMILAHSFPVAINTLPVTINQDMKAISTTLDPAYLAILLRGMKDVILSLVEEAAHGTKVMRTDLFKNIRLPVPPSAEQKAIVDAVKRVVDQTDLMVKRVSSAIDKLKEYRAALITAAVTGKIDVRGVSLPDSLQQEAA